MEHWDLLTVDIEPHHPQILSSKRGEARAIAIALASGDSLDDHEVHERAHLVVVEGSVSISADGESVNAGPGSLTVFAPGERHEIRATGAAARLLLVLAPWPGEGHPGARDA